MGGEYKARGTRLDRTVAVKVLPGHIAQGEDVRARFEPEARAVASLNRQAAGKQTERRADLWPVELYSSNC